jgi:hypothetical protein
VGSIPVTRSNLTLLRPVRGAAPAAAARSSVPFQLNIDQEIGPDIADLNRVFPLGQNPVE